MNKEQLQEIKARAEAAAPGPWGKTGDNPMIPDLLFGDRARENATFIAHARSDVPALCAEVERLRDNLAWLAERVISKELCPHSGVCPPEADCCVRCLREAEADKAVT